MANLVKSVMLKIVADDGDTEAKLDRITARAGELGRLHPDIKVKIDTAAAGAKLAVLRKELKDTGNAAAGSDSVSLKSRLMSLGSTAGVVSGLGDVFGAFNAQASMGARVMSGVSLATGLLEAPLAGAIAGAGGLAAGVTAAGAGLGVFGLVARSVYGQVSGALTKLTAAQQQYNKATTAKQQAAALKAEQQAMSGLTGSQLQFASALTTSKNQWSGFVKAASPGVTGVMAQGLRLLPDALKLMQPFLASTENGLTVILDHLKGGLQSSWLKDFARTMGTFSGPAIVGVGTAAGNVIKGIAGILKAFVPMGVTVLGGLDTITGKFAAWGQSLTRHSGFQSLMTMAQADMPYVIGIVKNLGAAIGHLGGSMTGLSTVSNSRTLLQLALPLSQLLNTLTKADPALVRFGLYALAAGGAVAKMKPAFQGISAGIGVIKGGAAAFRDLSAGFSNSAAAASDATGIWGTFGGRISTVTAAIGKWGIGSKIAAAATRVWTGVQAAFDVVMAMNPVGLIVIGIAALIAIIVICVVKFKAFREFWIGLWKDVKTLFGDALHWVESHWKLLPAIFLGPLGIVITLVLTHFRQIKSGAMSLVHDVTSFFSSLPGRILGALGDLGRLLWRAGVAVVQGLIGGITSMLGNLAGAVGNMVASIPGKILHVLGIGSPSRVTFYHGQMIAAGLALGIESGHSRVQSAAARLAQSAIPGRGGLAGAGAGAGGGQLVLEVKGGGTGLDQLFFTWLKENVRIRGGSPEVLGH